MTPSDLPALALEIAESEEFSRRLPLPQSDEERRYSAALNCLLSAFEKREQILKQRIDQLVEAHDDAKTTNSLLSRVRKELRERTKQLDLALKKSDAANDAKSQFLANMSHEIRTPMNGILGMAELLRRTNLNDHQLKKVDTIVNSGRALLAIINDILDFSKIESGRFDLDPQQFNLKTCLSDVVELLRPAADRKSLDLKLELEPNLPSHFVGDAGRIRQIVMNLAGNAVKFTDRGFVTLRLSGKVQNGEGVLCVDVIDTGIGIPEDRLSEVFDKFSQVDGSATSSQQGTGLGLTISQLLARRMNGNISVESKSGVGTKFSFNVALPVSEIASESMKFERDLTGSTITIVSKHIDVQAVSDAFNAADCQIHKLTDLADAIDCLNSKPTPLGRAGVVVFDICISEKMLRQIRELRQKIPASVLPLSVCVSSGAPGDARNVSLAGAQAFICGPIDSQDIVNSTARILQKVEQKSSDPLNRCDASDELVTRHTLIEQSGSANDLTGVTPLSDSKTSKVLLVEDSIVNQEVALEFLEDLDVEVAVANNGEEAVNASEKEKYDIVLMDCRMPVMDGFAATCAIRERTKGATHSDVPIIALSANAFESDREKCLSSGMSDFLSKPFLPADFEAVVQKWLPPR